MTLTVDDAVRAIVAPRTVVVHGVRATSRPDALDAAIADAEARLRLPDEARDAALSRTRAMYRRFGVDPTRTRPSSEALWRRVRKGERLPAINALVDVVNWCSVEAQVPFGLYDLARIGDAVTLRLGRDGEGYEGIRKEWVNVGARLVVADGAGAFGNPTSDSLRASVNETTCDVLAVLFVPPDAPAADADALADLTRQRLESYGRPATM